MKTLIESLNANINLFESTKTNRFNVRVEISGGDSRAVDIAGIYGLDPLDPKVQAAVEALNKIIPDSITAVKSEGDITYFKIPYDYADDAKRFKSPEQSPHIFSISKGSSNKVKIFCKVNGKGPKIELFETGSGSKCLGTQYQETMTCVTYNLYNEFKGSREELINILSILLSLDPPGKAGCFKKNGQLNSEGMTWVNSWYEHARILHENFGDNFIAIRYSPESTLRESKDIYNTLIQGVAENLGDNQIYDKYIWDSGLDKVIEAYNKALKVVQSTGAGSKKDHIDKSDIFLIDKSATTVIEDAFNSITEENYLDSIKHLTDLQKSFIGVSIKKIGANCNARLIRSYDKKITNVSNVTFNNPIQSNGALANEVSFTFTTPKHDYILTYRSFGDRNGADIKEFDGGKKGIALGKVPIVLVNSIIDDYIKSHSEWGENWEDAAMELAKHQGIINPKFGQINNATQYAWVFAAALLNDPNINQTFQRLANAALAASESCFPFVIIY